MLEAQPVRVPENILVRITIIFYDQDLTRQTLSEDTTLPSSNVVFGFSLQNAIVQTQIFNLGVKTGAFSNGIFAKKNRLDRFASPAIIQAIDDPLFIKNPSTYPLAIWCKR